MRELRYSPDQPRDSHGRFGSGGQTTPDEATGEKPARQKGDPLDHAKIAELHKSGMSVYRIAKTTGSSYMGTRLSLIRQGLLKTDKEFSEPRSGPPTPEPQREPEAKPADPAPEVTKPAGTSEPEKEEYKQSPPRVSPLDGNRGMYQQQVKERLAQLPQEHIDRMGRVTFQQGGLDSTKLGPGGAAGAYNNIDRGIKLGVGINNQRMVNGVLQHEVGHYVHLGKMTVRAADEWDKISDNGENCRISSYGQHCSGEHFAEAYRAYAQGKDKRDMLARLEPKAHAFMERLFTRPATMLLPPGSRASRGSFSRRYGIWEL